ncbi:hypothetical protein TSUD_182100 [Trifolium subterraneum]|uniref:Cupin type-1 domain-containing protein n=1 Tax=Trifolium subterraneum TaxID=3900 RepID=A0A2Z6PFI1_TRISU|nr:hypothetical protein TSUD_182100 [Trifolium subterraneum]
MAIKTPFQLLMLLGVVFLASSSVCVSSRRSDQDQENPFLLKSNHFQTLFENENGHIRLLQRFDKRSKIFENLQNYRLLEYNSKPHTLFLPKHNDADFILAVLSGKAILTVLKSNDRNSFNLERGDTIKLPAGTIAYLANRDDKEDLRVLDLAIPINRPGQVQSFLLSGSENQQSFLSGFSKNILEASFNADYEEIERVLIEEHQKESQHRRDLRDRRRQESQEANVIVKVSREQIEELNHLTWKTANLSIPTSHPVAVSASSNLYLVGFGINAENNQRNFLAGEEDNVISQIHRSVKELAFPGSAQQVDRLLKNQKQSYFANAQPQQREEESQRKRGHISSILEGF